MFSEQLPEEQAQKIWDLFLDLWEFNVLFPLRMYADIFDEADSLIVANGFGSPDNCLAVGGPLVLSEESE